mgnify:CR=1 FL=1
MRSIAPKTGSAGPTANAAAGLLNAMGALEASGEPAMGAAGEMHTSDVRRNFQGTS